MNSLLFRRGADHTRNEVDSSGALPLQFALLIVGFVGILIYALASNGDFASIFSVASLVALGAWLVGGLLGFLFGIPRTFVYDRLPSGAESRNSDKEEGRRLAEFDPNTNLVQISDWLTKILVGVGLTQLAEVPSALNRAATAIEGAFGSPPESHVFALAILVYFPMCGFFVGYLWTSLFLPTALTKAERLRWEEKLRNIKETEAILVAAAQVGQPQQEAINHSEEPLETIIPKATGLWVDDNPSNNISLKDGFERLLGIKIDLSLSTEDALQKLKSRPGEYAFIISDMGRPPDPEAGYTLLRALKNQGAEMPPFIIYATGAGSAEHRAEALRAGALGSTSRPQELLQLIQDALRRN